MNADILIDLITALWLGFTGACIGSFLNVVAYRLPRGLSVVWKPSHCPHCGHPIRVRDNVPVFGWLILRGKCRDCGSTIAARYAIVEGILGGVFFVLSYAELFSAGVNLPGGPFSQFIGAMDLVWHPDWPVIGLYVYHCTGVTILLTMALLDRDEQHLSRSLIVFAALVGILPPVFFGAPLLFPSPTSAGVYLLSVSAHVFFTVFWCLIISLPAGLMPEKIFNLAAALSVAGFFLGVSGLYRAAYFTIYLMLFLSAVFLRSAKPQWNVTNLDAVWLALAALLVGGLFMSA